MSSNNCNLCTTTAPLLWAGWAGRLLQWWQELGNLSLYWGSRALCFCQWRVGALWCLPSTRWLGQQSSNAILRAGFWCANVHKITSLQLLSFSAAGMRCKMLELLQTHWWRISSLCLLAFSWAQKTAFPLQLKQALTLHLDLQLQVCSLSGQHSSVEEMEQSWIQFILFKTWKNSNS